MDRVKLNEINYIIKREGGRKARREGGRKKSKMKSKILFQHI